MSRINTYPEASSAASDDYLLLDGSTNGTRKIKPSSLVDPTGTQSGMAADAKLTKYEIEAVKNDLDNLADFSEPAEIVNDTFSQTGTGRKTFTAGNLESGFEITVDVVPDSWACFSWDILTSNVVNGSTKRVISGGNSTNQETRTTFTLASDEHAITIRCIVIADVTPTPTRTGTVVATSTDPSVLPVIKEEVLPNTSRTDKTKRIVWFGTSIPAGAGYDLNYPLSLGRKLGVTVYNEAVGSSRARASWAEFVSASNPLGAGSAYGSLIKAMGYTLAEKQYFIDNYDSLKSQFVDTHPETLDADTQLLIKNYSFERKLYRYLNSKEAIYKTVNNDGFIGDVDIYVLDHGYNDVTGRYESDTTIPELGASNEMYYFAGALNRYIKEIMENDITAKIIIISHYANDEGTKDAVAVRMQNEVAQYWNIPIINIYKEIGWTNVEITINGTTKTVRNFWLPDGLHPHSDTSGKAIARYVDVLYPYFADILHM